MRSLFLFCASSLLVCGIASAEDPAIIPQPPGFDRYEEMLRQSLFAPVTIVEAQPPVENAPWSSNLYVSGVLQDGGKQSAMVENRETGERYMLKTGEEHPSGFALASIQYSPTVGQSEVTIRRGPGEFATLKFDQAQVVEPLRAQPTNIQEALRNRAPIGGGGVVMPNPGTPIHAQPQPSYPGAQTPGVPQRRNRRVISAPPTTPGP